MAHAAGAQADARSVARGGGGHGQRLRLSFLPCLGALLVLAGCASAPHPHYYGDDGPPAKVPPHLSAVPDATPRVEPLDPYANRPYSALGRRYVPMTTDAPFRQRGIASWYGRQYQGNRTASGEPYDMFAMTAAHPTLPIPSYARVTNLANGRSVVVRVNDRGPFLYDRVIDLSYAAATRLGVAGPGTAEVEVDRITNREIAEGSWRTGGEAAALAAAEPVPAAAAPGFGPGAGGVVQTAAAPAPRPVPDRSDVTSDPDAGEDSVDPVQTLLQAQDDAEPGRAAPAGDAPTHWSVQLGAFGTAAHANALRDRLDLLLGAPQAGLLPPQARQARVERSGGLNRVLIGDASDRSAAQSLARQLSAFLRREAVVVAH